MKQSIAIDRTLPTPHITPVLKTSQGYVKYEGQQRSGSVKYRLVYAKVTQALRQRRLRSKMKMVELSAGSTGIALAYAGMQIGLPVEIHVYEDVLREKVDLIYEYGGKVKFHPCTQPMDAIFEEINESVSSGEVWHLNQYDRDALIRSYEEYANEIAMQLSMLSFQPSYFVCPIGTGGLIQGVGCILRLLNPDIHIIAIEPEMNHFIDGLRNTEDKHMGEDDPYDITFPDRRVLVPAPTQRQRIDDILLGDSATAIFHFIEQNRLQKTFMVAPS